MRNKKISRREFARNAGLMATAGFLIPVASPAIPPSFMINTKNPVLISTDFMSGGGSVKLDHSDPFTLHVVPHNQGNGGWSQIWWYFKVSGINPGQELTILLESTMEGVNPNIKFSYDQINWGLTDTATIQEINGKEYFVYKTTVRGKSAWYAYDLPYTPEHIDSILIPKVNIHPDVEVIELCRTIQNHSVKALLFDNPKYGEKKYGIWLQARTHAFESGSSWVLHELANWLLSGGKKAKALLECARIILVPIVDVDGVIEGRTGKMQLPYDHNRGWDKEPNHWPETNKIKSAIQKLSKQNRADLFIDFHGPGNQRHPYFIILEAQDLPYVEQRENRARFFNILNAKPFDDTLLQTQSMTQFCYSARPWEKMNNGNSSAWVTMNSTKSNIALTLEVNMNTPLSTQDGYRAEGIALGQAISDYFSGDFHQK